MPLKLMQRDWTPIAAEEARIRRSNFQCCRPWSVIALVGLTFEARIAAAPGVFVVCRGQEERHYELLQFAIRDGCRGIISFGIGGGLASNLVPGDCVVASEIIDSHTRRPTDPIWSGKLLGTIRARSERSWISTSGSMACTSVVHHGTILGIDAVVADPAAKRQLHTTTGAIAVDMESHLVARFAARHALAFTALRVIVDPVDRSVPTAALRAMGPDGTTHINRMLRVASAGPAQLSGLMRIAADAYRARKALVQLRHLVGLDFNCE